MPSGEGKPWLPRPWPPSDPPLAPVESTEVLSLAPPGDTLLVAGERQRPLHNNVGTVGPFTLAAGRIITIPGWGISFRGFQDCHQILTAILGGSESESDLPRAAQPAKTKA